MGSFGKGCLIVAIGLLVFAIGLGGCGVSRYNSIVAAEQGVEAGWSEIQNQYKRRFDLVPQLVETVKGAADFEKSTVTEVTEARASVGRANISTEPPSDPAQLQAYMQAQGALGSALQRLLVSVERYPDLKASQNFLSLQDQLEGTENRIAVARRDYIDIVKGYNTSIRQFPNNFLASMFSFEKIAQLEFDDNVEEVPKVDFNFGENK